MSPDLSSPADVQPGGATHSQAIPGAERLEHPGLPSVLSLYFIGTGPSSSHTMGPRAAALGLRKRLPDAHAWRVHLHGSLAATGKGHLTDVAISDALAPAPVHFIWHPDTALPAHPNGMIFEGIDASGAIRLRWQGYSIGGGAVREEGADTHPETRVYPEGSLRDVLTTCRKRNESYWSYVERAEPGATTHLATVWRTMEAAVTRGLHAKGILPGGLGIHRRARDMFLRARRTAGGERTGMLAAYALAVAEENAAGGIVCTAPTCGSSGVLPAVLHFLKNRFAYENLEIYRALEVAGIFGTVVRIRASISGAEVGCQGEIGTACAMAAAAACSLLGGTLDQIEYAAEMGIEHHLGLTCDTVGGLVQIPCVERNAMAALRAIDCAEYALLTDGTHHVSFDEAVAAMNATGHDLPSLYRETSQGGLAVQWHRAESRLDSGKSRN